MKFIGTLSGMVDFENQNTQPNQRALNFNPTDKHSWAAGWATVSCDGTLCTGITLTNLDKSTIINLNFQTFMKVNFSWKCHYDVMQSNKGFDKK